MAILCLHAFVGREDIRMNYCFVNSPLGRLLLAGNDRARCYLGLPEGKARIVPQ